MEKLSVRGVRKIERQLYLPCFHFFRDSGHGAQYRHAHSRSDAIMADNPMLKFVETGQSYPEKRTADDRAADFNEITHSFRSEEHTSELQSLMRISYAVFCLQKKPILMHHNYHVIRMNK